MTEPGAELGRQNRLAVVVDICSSTAILEDLMLSNSEGLWQDLLIHVKRFLMENAANWNLTPYKFIGDGWILLFPRETHGTRLIEYLENIAEVFQAHFDLYVQPRLQVPPTTIGLTFGVDVGELVRLQMMNLTEYLGRPLNMASRLQGAIASVDPRPAYKVMFSRSAFTQLGIRQEFRPCEFLNVPLRNVRRGDQVQCVKLSLRLAGNSPAEQKPPAIEQRPSGGAAASRPYNLNINFDREQIKALLQRFRDSAKRPIDVSLAERLERELLQQTPALQMATIRQLARWCDTANPLYRDGMQVAREISTVLFGEVINRHRLRT